MAAAAMKLLMMAALLAMGVCVPAPEPDPHNIVVQGDIRLTKEQWAAMRSRKAIADVTKRWTEGPDGYPLVPYLFLDFVNRTKVRSALDHWMEHTCINFEETSNRNQPHLQFYPGTGSCNSKVGMMSRGQIVNIKETCSVGTIIHEVGHAIGFWHEQMRSDRDDYITILWDNVGNYLNFRKEVDNNYGVPYDYSSIMQSTIFMLAKDPLAQDILGTRDGLTHRDKLLANRMYNCTGKWLSECCISSDPCLNDGYTGRHCTCVCPPGTSGSLCEEVIDDYYALLRNPLDEKITTEKRITVETTIEQGTKFTKWIVPPTCKKAKLTFTSTNLYSKCRYQYLDVRTNVLDIKSQKLCAENVTAGLTLTSETEIIITMFHYANHSIVDSNQRTFWEADVTFENIPGCSVTNLPVNGGWSSWSSWSSCSSDYKQSRSRSCTNPNPRNGGQDCHGHTILLQSCTDRKCIAVIGGWSPWSAWSRCSSDCEKSSSRSCTNPNPQHGGQDCPGDSIWLESCTNGNCIASSSDLTEVDWSTYGSDVGATSQYSNTYRPINVFSEDGFWSSRSGCRPQTIWFKFSRGIRITKYSFTAGIPWAYPAAYIFFGSNSDYCTDKSKWKTLVEKYSMSASDDPTVENFDNKITFTCYGFKISRTRDYSTCSEKSMKHLQLYADYISDLTEVDWSIYGSDVGATSQWSNKYAPIKAFSEDGYWYSKTSCRPQTIWFKFSRGIRIKKYSFTAVNTPLLQAYPAEYIFFGSNSDYCGDESKWKTLVAKYSMSASDDPTVENVDNKITFTCYGFKISKVRIYGTCHEKSMKHLQFYADYISDLTKVDWSIYGSEVGATSQWSNKYAPIRAFSEGAFWYTGRFSDLPQTIWFKFSRDICIKKYSFTAGAPWAYPAEYIFFGSNSDDCTDESKWKTLVPKYSMSASDDPTVDYIDNKITFTCYGFKISKSRDYSGSTGPNASVKHLQFYAGGLEIQ